MRRLRRLALSFALATAAFSAIPACAWGSLTARESAEQELCVQLVRVETRARCDWAPSAKRVVAQTERRYLVSWTGKAVTRDLATCTLFRVERIATALCQLKRLSVRRRRISDNYLVVNPGMQRLFAVQPQ